MDGQLIAKDQITINSPVAKVWEVLVAPKYIRQWDDLPDGFDDYYLETGRSIEWAGLSKMTVTDSEPNKLLRLSLYVSKWELPPGSYDIAYTYKLTDLGSQTVLTVEIGDFSVLEDGHKYFEASVAFAKEALPKIKNLAENRV
jgi:uncharacterized protein YndB with AHSA1/START domain